MYTPREDEELEEPEHLRLCAEKVDSEEEAEGDVDSGEVSGRRCQGHGAAHRRMVEVEEVDGDEDEGEACGRRCQGRRHAREERKSCA